MYFDLYFLKDFFFIAIKNLLYKGSRLFVSLFFWNLSIKVHILSFMFIVSDYGSYYFLKFLIQNKLIIIKRNGFFMCISITV